MTNKRARQIYDWFKAQERELSLEAGRNQGRLPRHQHWRLAYYQTPYLLLEPNSVISERFRDVFTNSIDITEEGKIELTGFGAADDRLGRLFTELIEETNWRGILTRDSQKEAFDQLHSYFEGGEPLGVGMFKGYDLPSDGSYLLKFSQKEFVNEMIERGRFRISPASSYSKGNHIRAVKDLETLRTYKIIAIEPAMEGRDHVEIRRKKVPIPNGVIPLRLEMDDYYLFSTCSAISRRMPTDFEADAVLVIREKNEFLNRLKGKLTELLPGWEFLERNVFYYDPYTDSPDGHDQEFYKYFSYSYQKEHRCIMRPPRTRNGRISLEPVFIELGPLHDIAQVLPVTA